ncbi:hypothetical protein C1646_772815 [Rhizophagus diaphanus]|nr:hypothetical protein C1646_772815 [Rhizophagus diaphanus] [Rhizophagus sp. MUCL 43196]
MATIRQEIVITAINRVAALVDSNIQNNLEKQHDEKSIAVKIFNRDFDYHKIMFNQGTKRICENCHDECLATLYCGCSKIYTAVWIDGPYTEWDLKEKIWKYKCTAENGFTISMNNLATCYENGKGTEKNLEKAFYWFQKAAEKGYTCAMNNLGVSYYNGEGTEKNSVKAFYWCQKAAENGYTSSMHYLANRYYRGEGTEKNLEKAFY